MAQDFEAGMKAIRDGKLEQARVYFEKLESASKSSSSLLGLTYSSQGHGELELLSGNFGYAADRLRKAARSFKKMKMHEEEACARACLGTALCQLDPCSGISELKKARDLFQDLGDAEQANDCAEIMKHAYRNHRR